MPRAGSGFCSLRGSYLPDFVWSPCFSRSRMMGFSNTGDTALRAWFCCAAIGTGLLCGAALGAEPVPQPPASAGTLSLTVDEATALFLKQNLDLLIAQYGIESARGLEVT